MSVLKEPQSLDPQVTVQVAPAAVASFVSCTPTGVAPPAESEAGGRENHVIEIGRPTMVKVTLDDCDESLVTLAVIVTVPPTGAVEGAV